jgi:ATP-binding cassette subfamily C (CFTR/MRP) protein 1
MVAGPVGCGKTTLLKVLLGETNLKSGSISVSTTRIGYCSTKPWLRNETIKNNILSSNAWDEAWYKSILRICSLNQDLLQMPNQDETLVGSRGVVLSGGQKHRIALARALYARCPLLLLDDPFSSLDRKTRRRISSKLFDVDGFIRKHGITVVFVSHESEFSFPQTRFKTLIRPGEMARYANTVLTLGGGGSLKSFETSREWNSQNFLSDQISENTLEDEDSDEKEKELKSESRVAKKPEDEDPHEQIKRQVGDATVWSYYAKSAGLLSVFLLAFFTAVATTGIAFPRKPSIQWQS